MIFFLSLAYADDVEMIWVDVNVKKVCCVSGGSNPSSKVSNKATLDFNIASENETPTFTNYDEGMYPLCLEHYSIHNLLH